LFSFTVAALDWLIIKILAGMVFIKGAGYGGCPLGVLSLLRTQTWPATSGDAQLQCTKWLIWTTLTRHLEIVVGTYVFNRNKDRCCTQKDSELIHLDTLYRPNESPHRDKKHVHYSYKVGAQINCPKMSVHCGRYYNNARSMCKSKDQYTSHVSNHIQIKRTGDLLCFNILLNELHLRYYIRKKLKSKMIIFFCVFLPRKYY
jgi:hypothetical protein